jgi:hypothetical protein
MLMIKDQLKKCVVAAMLAVPTLCFAADKSCAAVNKAGELGFKQARIHYAGDLLRPALPNSLDKVSASAEKLMHSITVDNTNYMALDGVAFSTQTLKNAEERSLMSGVAVFQAIDEGCRSLGKAVVAGRNATVYDQGTTKTTDDTYFKFWIDAQTGLPLRTIENAASPEIKSFGATKSGRPNIEVKSNGKNERIINTIAFVFGDSVKPPKLGGSKNLFGQKGEMDAAADAALKGLIKGQ